MAPRGFEDEELTISLSSSQVRRQHRQQRAQQHGRDDAAARASTSRTNTMDSQPREKSRAEQRIGAYKIVRTLGEGSFGKVKLAIHNGTGQKVALKIIARKKLISRDMAGRVEREIEYLQLLRHPHIIKLYDPRTQYGVVGDGSTLTTRFTVTPLSRRRPKLSWFSSMPEENCSITLCKMAA